MVGNPIANCITIIRNGIITKKQVVFVQKTRVLYSFLTFLVRQGFLLKYSVTTINSKNFFRVFLKYTPNGFCIIKNLKIISTKTRRIYLRTTQLCFLNQLGVTYGISTSEGYLNQFEARQRKLGGELVFVVI